MKSFRKMQEKLLVLLKNAPALKLFPNPNAPWSDLELKEAAWVVQDFVNQSREVVECDPLKDWLEEYKFFMADNRT